MKDVLDTLRQVREKSKHTVDNSSLKKKTGCDAILTPEKRIEENSKGHTALDYLSWYREDLALIKLEGKILIFIELSTYSRGGIAGVSIFIFLNEQPAMSIPLSE